MVENLAVGIDLGTTYSCISVYQNGEPVVVLNRCGNKTTPSIVAFKGGEILVGEAAKNQAHRNVKNTIYGVKRLIGRSINDPLIQDDLKRFPFDKTIHLGKVGIKAEVNGEERICSCEEISSHVLKELKNCAEEYLQCEVKEAVISIPAYFNNAQRKATREAAHLASLKVLRLINEPTAGAMTYATQLKSESMRNILVFDLGGGTFDVSVLKVCGSSDFEVRATGGDAHLGGEDFDSHLVEFCLQNFSGGSKEAEYSKKALSNLRMECEKTKKMLSTSFSQTIEVASFHGDEDLSVEVHRFDFERVNQALFDRTIEVMKDVLESNRIERSEIDEVLLVGGSCRIPKVKEMVEAFFGKKPHTSNSTHVCLDTAVACGAAICAADRPNNAGQTGISLKEVAPRSIGIRTKGNRMYFFLKANKTYIPFQESQIFSTIEDSQDRVGIDVREGESKDAYENDFLGYFELRDITKAPAGNASIEVKFIVDENRILKVTAEEIGANQKKALLIEESCLTEESGA